MWICKTDDLPPRGVDLRGAEVSGAEALISEIPGATIRGMAFISGMASTRSLRVTSARPVAS